MTCIVGIVEATQSSRRIWMAADSGASDESIILPVQDKKIARNGKYLIGYAGDFGLGQLLHTITLPDPTGIKENELLKFMRLKFVPAYKKALKLYAPENIETDEDSGMSALIAVNGVLFEFDSSDYQLNQYRECAIGSGSAFAFGALYSSRNYKDIRKRALKAVHCAIEYSPSCLGPVHIDSI